MLLVTPLETILQILTLIHIAVILVSKNIFTLLGFPGELAIFNLATLVVSPSHFYITGKYRGMLLLIC